MAAIDSNGVQLINGRYRVISPLHEGGFGQTFLVEDTHLPSQRRCVLKLLKPVQDNPEFYRLVQDRFQREAAIQETLGEICQQIPRLYAYFSEGDRFYLVEEWIDGDTLSAEVAEVGRFSEAAVTEILSRLLPTVEIVHHHQIIHRDIKPDNVILRKRDGKPVLIDFGAVKESMGAVLDSKGLSAHSIVIGTAGYMPPEQSAGRPLYTSDLYSLGMTAIYLLTGRSPAELHSDPYTGRIEWRSQVPQISPDLGRVIDTAISIHPQDRFSSAQTMLQALQSVQPKAISGDIPTLISQPHLGIPAPNGPQTPAVPPQNQPPSTPPYYPPANAPANTPVNTPVTAPVYPDSHQEQNSRNDDTGSTQVIAPTDHASRTIPSYSSTPSGRNDWIKAALIGGGIGVGLLMGLLLVLRKPAVVYVQSSPSPVPVNPSRAPSPSAAPSNPVASPAAVSPETPSTTPSPVAAETCGDPGGSGQNWYPVFIDNGNLGQVRQQYCQDAIAKTRDNGTPSIQVASFTSRQRAADFADRVGGDVGEPYRIGASKPTPSPTATTEPSPPRNGTNASIVGDPSAKNIRRGPGSQYPVQHIAYPGDRVKVISSEPDSGGYLWYQIYFPKSGASGWIAGQLLRLD